MFGSGHAPLHRARMGPGLMGGGNTPREMAIGGTLGSGYAPVSARGPWLGSGHAPVSATGIGYGSGNAPRIAMIGGTLGSGHAPRQMMIAGPGMFGSGTAPVFAEGAA
ncbi:MAG TPA: hypothetical protein VFJ16_02690 [Longimicrobium sp.]|nr:hypothetical protein [Longimicrobium sp.]